MFSGSSDAEGFTDIMTTDLDDDDFYDMVIEALEAFPDRYSDFIVEGDIDSPSG